MTKTYNVYGLSRRCKSWTYILTCVSRSEEAAVALAKFAVEKKFQPGNRNMFIDYTTLFPEDDLTQSELMKKHLGEDHLP